MTPGDRHGYLVVLRESSRAANGGRRYVCLCACGRETTQRWQDLRARFGGVAFDLTTTKGDKEARAARMELVKLRTSLEAKRKELKAPALERSRMIDSEAKRIEAGARDFLAELDAMEKQLEAA